MIRNAKFSIENICVGLMSNMFKNAKITAIDGLFLFEEKKEQKFFSFDEKTLIIQDIKTGEKYRPHIQLQEFNEQNLHINDKKDDEKLFKSASILYLLSGQDIFLETQNYLEIPCHFLGSRYAGLLRIFFFSKMLSFGNNNFKYSIIPVKIT